jgi:hypothetical protein
MHYSQAVWKGRSRQTIYSLYKNIVTHVNVALNYAATLCGRL